MCGRRLLWRESRSMAGDSVGMVSVCTHEESTKKMINMQMEVWEREVLKEWKYDDDLCVWGTKETEIYVLFECKCYDMVMKRWMKTWDVLDEKERTMDVIKGYVEVSDDVEKVTMK